MSETKAFLYVNSKGYYVTRHSYSGSDSYHYCSQKYYLERVQGWTDKIQRSSTVFGTALEAAVKFYHQHRQDVAASVAEFNRLWAEHKDKPYSYTKSDMDWNRLSLSGQEMIRLYAIRYPKFPYIINNPMDSFQVERTFEVFPGTKLSGIEFTSYIDMLGQLKGTFSPLIIDMKTSGKDVPDFTILDPQLRSYSWVWEYPDVAFLWFRKCGRSISAGDNITLLEPYGGQGAGDDLIVMDTDDFGLWVTQNKRVVDEMDAKFKGNKKEVIAARLAYIQSNGVHVLESVVTKQKVQFKNVVISKESSEDIGRSIKKDIISIHGSTENDFWPMQSGVRFPNEKCPMCSMRGICAGNNELRDQLLMRKQLDEFDFGKESE